MIMIERVLPSKFAHNLLECQVKNADLYSFRNMLCRYVGGHAVIHRNTSGHPMAISLTDISVWCYVCEAYVHNDILLPAKNEVH
uniref:UBP-type domain-containing protein n=1 Tax=Parascaris equorum TaxID=6256 RepID=A0A914RFB2_PAREQ